MAYENDEVIELIDSLKSTGCIFATMKIMEKSHFPEHVQTIIKKENKKLNKLCGMETDWFKYAEYFWCYLVTFNIHFRGTFKILHCLILKYDIDKSIDDKNSIIVSFMTTDETIAFLKSTPIIGINSQYITKALTSSYHIIHDQYYFNIIDDEFTTINGTKFKCSNVNATYALQNFLK